MKRSPTNSSKNDKSKKINRKIKRMRDELDEVMNLVEEFDNIIKEKSETFISDKINSNIKKEVERRMKSVKLILSNDITNQYYDYVRKTTHDVVKQEILKRSKVEMKSFNVKDTNQESLLGLIKNGWHIAFHGDLKEKDSSKEPRNIFLLERSALKKGSKVPTKKKVKRKPA